jgi:hypothetical protein
MKPPVIIRPDSNTFITHFTPMPGPPAWETIDDSVLDPVVPNLVDYIYSDHDVNLISADNFLSPDNSFVGKFKLAVFAARTGLSLPNMGLAIIQNSYYTVSVMVDITPAWYSLEIVAGTNFMGNPVPEYMPFNTIGWEVGMFAADITIYCVYAEATFLDNPNVVRNVRHRQLRR